MVENKPNKNSVQEGGENGLNAQVQTIESISSLKDVFLVLFGTMLSIFITILLSNAVYNHKISFLLCSAIMAFIFLVFAFLDGIYNFLSKFERNCNANKEEYLIGIIRSGRKFEADKEEWKSQINNPPKWSGLTCKDWNDKLSECFGKSIIVYVSPKDDFTRFNCIVNPYGGAYYEESFSEQKSLHKILKYTSGGGVYVNVSDIPFFYAHNIETGFWLYNSPAFNVLRHFATEGQQPFENGNKSTTDATFSYNFPQSSDKLNGVYTDYNFYIFKDLGITFLMPVGGGKYQNLTNKITITFDPDGENIEVPDIPIEDTRPFLSSGFCHEKRVKVEG